MDIQFSQSTPTAREYCQLRAKVGWGDTSINMAQIALNNSLIHFTARTGTQLVGMVRVIGDGAMFFYIQDLVVDPDFQGQGIGQQLMDEIERYLDNVAKKGATIGLFSAFEKEPFYLRYGYTERTGKPLGLGMCKFI